MAGKLIRVILNLKTLWWDLIYSSFHNKALVVLSVQLTSALEVEIILREWINLSANFLSCNLAVITRPWWDDVTRRKYG